MLLTSTLAATPCSADEPNRIDGRAMAYGTPVAARCRSTAPLPLKYGYGDAVSACRIETYTMRAMPARAAASNRTLLLATADSLVAGPRPNRTQYVQYRVCAPVMSLTSASGSPKSSGRVSMSPAPDPLRGCPVSVRT